MMIILILLARIQIVPRFYIHCWQTGDNQYNCDGGIDG